MAKKKIAKKLTALELIKSELAILRKENKKLHDQTNTLNYYRGHNESNFVVLTRTVQEQAARLIELEQKVINSQPQ